MKFVKHPSPNVQFAEMNEVRVLADTVSALCQRRTHNPKGKTIGEEAVLLLHFYSGSSSPTVLPQQFYSGNLSLALYPGSSTLSEFHSDKF